jgi:hypothetical protein
VEGVRPVFPLGSSSSESSHYPDEEEHQRDDPQQIENNRSPKKRKHAAGNRRGQENVKSAVGKSGLRSIALRHTSSPDISPANRQAEP